MPRYTVSALATPRGRRWMLLCIGFTVATLQLCGLALLEPSLQNAFNVAIVLFFYALTWSLIPDRSRPAPRFARQDAVTLADGTTGTVRSVRDRADTWLYEVEIASSRTPRLHLTEAELRALR